MGRTVTKRYREAIEVTAGEEPMAFRWRGGSYRVRSVLGHWREDAGYWSGGALRIPQRDLWRVEACPTDSRTCGTPTESGVYELVCEAGRWRLDRIWD